jgi:hypothetical protein
MQKSDGLTFVESPTYVAKNATRMGHPMVLMMEK